MTITKLKKNEIFVFGSNAQGNHAGGAAKMAHEKFGAEMGIARGMTGKCYAIDTMSGFDVLKEQIEPFISMVIACPDKVFLLTEIGCGIAGFKVEQIAPLFSGTTKLENLKLPESFIAEIEKQAVVFGFKGYDKDLKCRGFQYELGKEYEHKGPVRHCSSGFHFCENPLDIFNYYPPGTSRYTSVKGSGKVSKDTSDTKVAVSKLKIGVEVNLKKIIEGGIKFCFDRVNWTKENTSNGNRSGATSNGNNSGATSNGYNSGATSNGDNSGATSNGNNSGATSNGYNSGATSNGYRSGATSNGDGSGATSNGYSSGATSNGYRSGATSNGNNSGATSNGYNSGATSNGDNSGATSNGNNSGATSNGYNSEATSNGDNSGATSNGYRSGATSNGYSSGATSNGDYSGATSNGNRSGAMVCGDNGSASTVKGGVATVIGRNGKAKGSIGAWLVIADGEYDKRGEFYIKDLKSTIVDGKKIKADTWYKLSRGRFVVVK